MIFVSSKSSRHPSNGRKNPERIRLKTLKIPEKRTKIKKCALFLQKDLEVSKFFVPLQSHSGKTCRSSSVGRSQPCQGWGREFEPRLLLQDKQGHLRMTLNFENTVASAISPDGVQSYVSRPCAQGGFFYGSTENRFNEKIRVKCKSMCF